MSIDDPRETPLKPGDDAPEGTPGTGENVCQTCAGDGQMNGERCPTCLGTGLVQEGVGGG